MGQADKIKKTGRLAAAALLTAGAAMITVGVRLPASAREIDAYICTINGEEIGMIGSGQMLNNALAAARARLTEQSGEVAYLNVEYSLEPVKADEGKLLKQEALEEAVFETVKGADSHSKEKAYTIKIDQFTITVDSKEEAIALLEEAKAPYDKYGEFSVELIQDTTKELAGYTVRLSRNTSLSEEDEDGTLAGVANLVWEAEEEHDGELLNLSFAQKVEIVETCVAEDQIVSYEDAIAAVTKEKEKNKVYEVESGDCLSVIAEKTETSVDRIIALNELSGENATIHAGDELIVTVPEPELSVVMEIQTTYEEDYTKVEYVDNDSWYTTREEVRQEGTVGRHRVTDRVTYENGLEIGRTQIGEEILVESTPKIVERGTVIPPTYIMPISNGRFTSGFKMRWGRMHKGVDWACPIGTAVKASCAGTVVQSGWSNGYGYCITLRHADGRQTRYGHLKKTLVSVGQAVSQGEKIGLSGNTGRSTGPHLHFEILINGTQVDPLKYLE